MIHAGCEYQMHCGGDERILIFPSGGILDMFPGNYADATAPHANWFWNKRGEFYKYINGEMIRGTTDCDLIIVPDEADFVAPVNELYMLLKGNQ